VPTPVTVRFSQILQDRQDLGGEEQMVSTVYFDVEAGGRVWVGLEANVKQTAGAAYEEGPLEVELPAGYDGPMNYSEFRECVEAYYRSAVSQGGRMISFGPGARIHMRNNRFAFQQECSFEAE